MNTDIGKLADKYNHKTFQGPELFPFTEEGLTNLINDVLQKANAEIERLTVAMNKYSEDEMLCQTKLAASQLREKVLREALEPFVKRNCSAEVIELLVSTKAIKAARSALSQQTYDSALREFVADEMVNMIDKCYPHECRDYAERYRKCEV